jgi:glycosyltransferase involved in cell wall biosynthesis
MKKLWLAWEDDTSIRSRVLATELGADYRAFTRFDRSRWFRWLRYPVAAVQTLAAIASHRPDLLVVQNPSILLSFQAAVLRPLFGYTLAIDLHTPLRPPAGTIERMVDVLHRYSLRHSDLVIVTNEGFRARVARQTSSPVLILPDKVPDLGAPSGRYAVEGAFNVLYICTYSQDEPWREVLKAAPQLPADVRVYVSGRSPLAPGDVPAGVVPTGYLPRQDYQNLLATVDAVMVLTTAEENLVCGGYEAVAAGKPVLLSDTQALRALFRKGSVFTRNDAASIARSIRELRERHAELQRSVRDQKVEMSDDWSRLWQLVLRQAGVAPAAEPSPVPAAVE